MSGKTFSIGGAAEVAVGIIAAIVVVALSLLAWNYDWSGNRELDRQQREAESVISEIDGDIRNIERDILIRESPATDQP